MSFSKSYSFLIVLCIFHLSGISQNRDASGILHDLHRLKSPYRALYLAAHPDDENTRLIAYLTGEEKVQAAYLSLTRGDGGQNLVGSEKGPLLGVLRTEELLSARRLDLADQYFTHAVDFGYSKTSTETFSFWGKESVLNDVVYVIREFKPHIVVNRFPNNDSYSGHGHHQASAELSDMAFKLASDSSYNTGQDVWNPGSLLLNSSSWWDKSLPERAKNDGRISVVNIGKYNPLLGMSYNELSAYSRSQHKSQGFGSAPSQGDQYEYLELLQGIQPEKGLFSIEMLDESDKKWLDFSAELSGLISNFNPNHPEHTVDGLLTIRKSVLELANGDARFRSKLELLDKILMDCMGMVISISADKQEFTRGEPLKADVGIVNRSSHPVILHEIRYNDEIFSWNRLLEDNVLFEDTFSSAIPKTTPLTNPYWLENSFNHVYRHDQDLLKHPNNDFRNQSAGVIFQIDSQLIEVDQDICYKWTDRVKGGLSQPIRIMPEVTLSLSKRLYFAKNGEANGTVVLHSHSASDLNGKIVLSSHPSVKVEIQEDVELLASNRLISMPFSLTLTDSAIIEADLEVCFVSGEDTFGRELHQIEYEHVDDQQVLLPVKSKVMAVNCPEELGNIGYVPGPDNEMIEYLQYSGAEIQEVTEDDVLNNELGKFDVILFGIRSLNVEAKWLGFAEQFMEYMKNGGTVVVQYQTSRGFEDVTFSPYPFEISRNRVTDETANTKILNDLHPILNQPFNLTKGDFKDWPQERGLYFADNYHEKFEALLSWHDPEEMDVFGGLIVARQGKGAFIYTGISFFRHIPAGVPGSYKLLFNILSYKP